MTDDPTGTDLERRRLDELAVTIRTEVEAAKTDFESAVQRAVRVGEALTEAKGLIRHGQWLPWLREHFSISERSAQRYMQLAAKSATVADLPNVRAALGMASGKGRDDEFVQAVAHGSRDFFVRAVAQWRRELGQRPDPPERKKLVKQIREGEAVVAVLEVVFQLAGVPALSHEEHCVRIANLQARRERRDEPGGHG
jgi:Protein of unknown function (DUF3102)